MVKIILIYALKIAIMAPVYFYTFVYTLFTLNDFMQFLNEITRGILPLFIPYHADDFFEYKDFFVRVVDNTVLALICIFLWKLFF